MTEQGVTRKLTAIMSADVKGYSRLMADDEAATVKCLTAHRQIISRLVDLHHGRVIDSPGDNVLAEFASAVNAVQCALEVQEELRVQNADLPEQRRMEWRIGINLGDVIAEGERIYGDGVNVAARIEGIAEAGGICISRNVYDQVKTKLSLDFEYLGEHAVKNISEPVRVYQVRLHPATEARRVKKKTGVFGSRWHKLVAAVAAVLIVAAAVAIMQHSFQSPPKKPPADKVKALPLPDKPPIAVLPFVNTSGDPKQDFLSDGITEQLIYALSRVPGLFVIARASSFFYKGKKVTVRQVGRELGVKYVLEGNVDRSGDRLRITAQLIDARTGRHLWAARWDRKLKDIFAIQDAVTLKVVRAVLFGTVWKWKDIDRFIGKTTRNLEALLALLKAGKYWSQYTLKAIFKAKRLARRAIALDPQFPAAYALLAAAYMLEVSLGGSRSPRKSLQKAVALCQKALAIDKSHPNAHTILAYLYFGQKRYHKALAQAERAIAANPNWDNAYMAKGIALYGMGRFKQSIQAMEKAIRLNPKAPSHYFQFLGDAYTGTRQYGKAIAALKKALSLAPNYFRARLGLVVCYVRTGQMKLARAEAAQVLRINPKFSLALYARVSMIKDRARLKRTLDTLRKAGLK